MFKPTTLAFAASLMMALPALADDGKAASENAPIVLSAEQMDSVTAGIGPGNDSPGFVPTPWPVLLDLGFSPTAIDFQSGRNSNAPGTNVFVPRR